MFSREQTIGINIKSHAFSVWSRVHLFISTCTLNNSVSMFHRKNPLDIKFNSYAFSTWTGGSTTGITVCV